MDKSIWAQWCNRLGRFNGPTPDIEAELQGPYAYWRIASILQLLDCPGMAEAVR